MEKSKNPIVHDESRIKKAVSLSGVNEIEFRLGTFIGYFQSGVKKEDFFRLKKHLDENLPEKKAENTIDYYALGDSKDRKTKNRLTKDKNTGEKYLLEKEKVQDFDYPDYGVRLSLSRETKSTNEEDIKAFEAKMSPLYREKSRWIYPFKDFVFHLTEVISVTEKGNETTWEIELEAQPVRVDPKDISSRKPTRILESLPKGFIILLQNFYQTPLVYSLTERQKAFLFLNEILGTRNSDHIDTYKVPKARNLKREDFVPGGILPLDNGVNYYCSPKANGENMYLLLTWNGFYFARSPDILIKWSGERKDITGKKGQAILQGEMIPDSSVLRGRDKSFDEARYRFLIFDVLMYGGKEVVTKGYRDRLGYTKELFSDFDVDKIAHLSVKPAKWLGDIPQLYGTINQMLDQKYSYSTDGLIFTPNTGYFFVDLKGGKIPLRQRRLPIRPDICKWKPPEEMTVDLRYVVESSPQGERINVYMGTSSGKGEIPFQGSLQYPFSPKTIRKPENPLNKKIYEFRWDGKELIPVRLRSDKEYPNNEDVVLDVWQDIHDPFLESILRGKSFGLFEDRVQEARKLLLRQIEIYFIKHSPDILLLDGTDEDVESIRPFAKTISLLKPEVKSRISESKTRGPSESKVLQKEKGVGIYTSLSQITSTFDAIFCGESIGTYQPEELAQFINKSLRNNGIFSSLSPFRKLFHDYLETGAVIKKEGKSRILPLEGGSMIYFPEEEKLVLKRGDQEVKTLILAPLSEIYGALKDLQIELLDQGGGEGVLLPDDMLTIHEKSLLECYSWAVAQNSKR